MSQDPAVPVWVRRVTTTAVVAVAGVAAIASYEHMRAVASVAGEDWRAWLLPISVDGLAVAASMTMLVRRRAGEPAGVLPWVALLLGLGASLTRTGTAAVLCCRSGSRRSGVARLWPMGRSLGRRAMGCR